MRYINAARIIAAQMTTPAENPLVTDDSRLMDLWFQGDVVRKQMFKKVKKSEQEVLVAELLVRGFIQSGNLLIDPKGVLFAEIENELLGGIITIGYQEGGKPVELKVTAKAFSELCSQLTKQ